MRITQIDFKSTSFRIMIHSESLVIIIHLYNMGMPNVKWLVGKLFFFFFFLSLFSVILGNWLDKFGGPPIQIYFIDFTK